MCLAFYIAADQEPPLVSWNEAAPGFNVVPIKDHERVVTRHLSKPALRYLGAHTGCSCGFHYGVDPAETDEDRDEDRLGRESVASLRKYLEGLVTATETVELYACWEGDWEEPCESRREVTVDYFGGESFELQHRELLIVRAAAANPTGAQLDRRD